MEGCNENFPGVITKTHLPNSTSSLYVVSKHRSGFVAEERAGTLTCTVKWQLAFGPSTRSGMFLKPYNTDSMESSNCYRGYSKHKTGRVWSNQKSLLVQGIWWFMRQSCLNLINLLHLLLLISSTRCTFVSIIHCRLSSRCSVDPVVGWWWKWTHVLQKLLARVPWVSWVLHPW